jgi:hypothetical protein
VSSVCTALSRNAHRIWDGHYGVPRDGIYRPLTLSLPQWVSIGAFMAGKCWLTKFLSEGISCRQTFYFFLGRWIASFIASRAASEMASVSVG